jgi:hypothetical protein
MATIIISKDNFEIWTLKECNLALEDSMGLTDDNFDDENQFRGYTYAQVEAALARMHGIDERSAGAFRGRIKNFQRLGIVPSSPGKGKKIVYSFADTVRWGLCLELSEFGMAPEYIKRIVAAIGDSVQAALKAPRIAKRPVILLLSPHLLDGEYDGETIANLATISPMTTKDLLFPASKLQRILFINLTRFRDNLLHELTQRIMRDMDADDPDNAPVDDRGDDDE